MNLLKDLWAHLKEWSDWKMKDWIKAGIVTLVVLFVIYKMTNKTARVTIPALIQSFIFQSDHSFKCGPIGR